MRIRETKKYRGFFIDKLSNEHCTITSVSPNPIRCFWEKVRSTNQDIIQEAKDRIDTIIEDTLQDPTLNTKQKELVKRLTSN